MVKVSKIFYLLSISINIQNLIFAQSIIESFTQSLESSDKSANLPTLISQDQIPQFQLSEQSNFLNSIIPSSQTLEQKLLNTDQLSELTLFPIQQTSDDLEGQSQSRQNIFSGFSLQDKSTFLSKNKDLVSRVSVQIPKYLTAFYLFKIKVHLFYKQKTDSEHITEKVMIDSNFTLNGVTTVFSKDNIAYFQLFSNQTGPALVRLMTDSIVFIFDIFIHYPVVNILMEAKMVIFN